MAAGCCEAVVACGALAAEAVVERVLARRVWVVKGVAAVSAAAGQAAVASEGAMRDGERFLCSHAVLCKQTQAVLLAQPTATAVPHRTPLLPEQPYCLCLPPIKISHAHTVIACLWQRPGFLIQIARAALVCKVLCVFV